MHVAADLNLNWFLQFIVTTLVVGLGFGLHRLLKNTASKYFVFEDPTTHSSFNTLSFHMAAADASSHPCAVCTNYTTKRCSACKFTSYCSQECQRSHWVSEHKAKCNDLKLISKSNAHHFTAAHQERKASSALSPNTADIVHHSGKILFPYDEFVELFSWEGPGFPPCGLLNCGNSCFANVVLQCLAYTKPLVAYLLVKGHRRECRRNDWCFLCEFQMHLERSSQSSHPFSPINILSRLPNIGGNLGHGSQEDAHEFMRFAIDTMQSVCLDQFGGEKAVHPRSQETTLIQHIFGGQLQSQVICTKCNNISNQLENMMDLTVEIQGDAASLEECLDQFTAKEWLHGENMYKCDRCNEYVTAWKRLSVLLPPNILTIAFKRFQSGRFGKLNKRVTFPEKVDLGPYMSKAGDDNDIYKLYAVIVHVDMLNASFFGHYICYVKDFRSQWYRIDDCKVARVDLDEVLSQGAYMLLYSRARARPRCMSPSELNGEEISNYIEQNEESPSSINQSAVECPSVVSEVLNIVGHSDSSAVSITFPDSKAHSSNSSEDVMEIMDKVDPGGTPFVKNDVGVSDEGCYIADEITIALTQDSHGIVQSSGDTSLSCKSIEKDLIIADTVRVATAFVKNDVGVSDEGCYIADEIAIAPTQYSNGIVQSSGDTYLSCKSIEKDRIVADTVIISDVEENKSEGSIKDTSFANNDPLTSSRSTAAEVARKCNGTDYSGLKLKPIFSPGFLGKQQQKKLMKRTVDLLDKQQKPSSSGLSCTPSNGFADPNVQYQVDSFRDKKNPYRCIEASSNNISKDTDMVDVDFTGQEAGGDSASLITPSSMTDINMLDVKELVEDKPDPW